MSQKAGDIILLLLLIMIYGMNPGEFNRGQAHLTWNNGEMEIRISFERRHNVTVWDTAGRLVCNSTNSSCYIECSSNELFENKTFIQKEPFTMNLTINDQNKTRVDFSIDNTTSSCILVDCLSDDIKDLLNVKAKTMKMPQDMSNILNIKRMCNKVVFSDPVVTTYIGVEKKAIQNIINMSIPEQSKIYYQEDLSITVVKMNLSKTEDFFSIAAPSVLNMSQVADIQIPLEPFKNENQTIGVVTYDSDQHFKIKVVNKTFFSKVIRIEVPGRDISNLNNPLKMRFKLNKPDSNVSCQFYIEKGSVTDGFWSTAGCLTNKTSDDVVECSCDHMTPFAVLLADVNIDAHHWEILSYISYVGCGLSAFFSACTVLLFIFSSNARAEVSNSIHVSLSAALFLLNLSFMFSEWAATLTVNEVCVFIAVMIHYSLLCSFTWMAIEAMHLYLLLIRVFNINIRHYMVKLSLIGWGVPAVLVGSLMSVQQLTHTFYGARNVTLLNSKATNPVCWITEPLILYGVNLSYFTIIFVFNTVVLITVSRQIFKLRKLDNKNKKIPVKDASTVLGLMCLLGTSWGLVFLGYGYTSYPILYIFCISNTIQGFSIFLWMCRTARPEKQKEAHSKSLSTLDTFIIEKQ